MAWHCRCTRAVPTAAWKVWVGVCRGLPPHQLRRSGACAPAVPRRAVRRVVLREMSAICQDARSPSVEVLCTNKGTVSTVCGLGRSLGCVDRAKPRVRPRRTSAVGCGPEATLKLRLGSSMGISTRCMVERWCATRLGTRCFVPCWTAASHDTCPHCGTTPCDVRSWQGCWGLRVPPSSSLVGQNARRWPPAFLLSPPDERRGVHPCCIGLAPCQHDDVMRGLSDRKGSTHRRKSPAFTHNAMLERRSPLQTNHL